MKKLIIWLLLLVTSFSANAQLIGGGPRKPKVSGSTVDLSGYAVKAANNLFSGSNTFSGTVNYSAPWTSYQAIFGSTGQGGRISFVRGSDGLEGLRIGFTGASVTTTEITAASNAFLGISASSTTLSASGGNGVALIQSSGSSGIVQLTASGTASGQVRIQTGSTESARIFTNGNTVIGSDGTDDGSKLRVQGTANIGGQLTSQDIVPDGNGTRNLGSSANRYAVAWANSVLSNGAAAWGSNVVSGTLFIRQGSTGNHNIAGYHGTTGNYFNQAAGAVPPDNGARFQNYGTSYLGGDVQVGGHILPATNSVWNLGATNQRFNVLYANAITSGFSTNPFAIRSTNNSDINFYVHPTTRNTTIQAPGAAPTDRGYTLDVLGNMATTGTFFLNDGSVTKTTAGSFTFSGSTGAQALITNGGNFVTVGSSNAMGTGSANASAVLTIASTTKGFLPPVMTEANKNTIPSPAEGLMIYQNSGVKGWYGYDGTAWIKLNP